MVRPARRPEEARAVREAAEIVRQETDLTAVSAISQEIARRVTADLTTFVEQDADEPMAIALEQARLSLYTCPFHTLATDPEIDTLELFIANRIIALRFKNGRYLTKSESILEFDKVMESVKKTLKNRYSRFLSHCES